MYTVYYYTHRKGQILEIVLYTLILKIVLHTLIVYSAAPPYSQYGERCFMCPIPPGTPGPRLRGYGPTDSKTKKDSSLVRHNQRVLFIKAPTP